MSSNAVPPVPPVPAPLITQWYCDAKVGCLSCWGSDCPSGQLLYTSIDDCRTSAACQKASEPKWYCAPCQGDASKSCCWVCKENGCPKDMGTTYETMMNCITQSPCRSNYEAYLGGQVNSSSRRRR